MRWVAFLRAINIGNRRVTGERLKAIFEGLGHEDVSSYQASGNVLFTADEPQVAQIEEALESGLGYSVPTALRTQSDIRRIVTETPFTDAELEATEGRIQVMLLRDPMTADQMAEGLPDIPEDDLVRLRPAEVFWLPRAGISSSRLSPPAVERLVGPLTVRTLSSVERIDARL